MSRFLCVGFFFFDSQQTINTILKRKSSFIFLANSIPEDTQTHRRKIADVFLLSSSLLFVFFIWKLFSVVCYRWYRVLRSNNWNYQFYHFFSFFFFYSFLRTVSNKHVTHENPNEIICLFWLQPFSHFDWMCFFFFSFCVFGFTFSFLILLCARFFFFSTVCSLHFYVARCRWITTHNCWIRWQKQPVRLMKLIPIGASTEYLYLHIVRAFSNGKMIVAFDTPPHSCLYYVCKYV